MAPWLDEAKATFLYVPYSLDSGLLALPSGAGLLALQGYLAHKKQPHLLGPPKGPRHRPTAKSYGGAVSYEEGTPVTRANVAAAGNRHVYYRVTSLIRECPPLEDHHRTLGMIVLL